MEEYTPKDLVVLVPMLGRAHRVVPLLDSIDATVPGARVLFLVTPGDGPVRDAVARVGREELPVVRQPIGDYARKINFGWRATTEPLMFFGADDLRFHPGWFEAAVAQLRPGIGVVGTNDLGSPRVIAGEHATHSLVTRRYVDRFGLVDQMGYALYEGYPHEWVDDEQVGTAKKRGAWAMAIDSHVEHLHPNWGKAPNDPMYQQQAMRMRMGWRIYNQRKRLWT